MAELGWTANELHVDTGEDLLVKVFDEQQPNVLTPSALTFLVQLKSTDQGDDVLVGALQINARLKVADLLDWVHINPPVVIFVWDVTARRGYWRIASEVAEDLDAAASSWRNQETVAVAFRFDDASDDESLKSRLRKRLADILYPSIANGRSLAVTVRLSFSNTEKGRAAAAAFRSASERGTPCEIAPEFVADLAFPEWYKKLYGTALGAVGSITMAPRPPDVSIQTRIEVRATGVVEQTELMLRAIRWGTKEAELSNTSDREAPLWLTMTVVENEGTKLNLGLNRRVLSWRKSIEVIRVLEAMSRGLAARILVRGRGQWESFGATEGRVVIKENLNAAREALEALAVLESYGDLAGAFELDELDEEDVRLLRALADGCRTGQALDDAVVTMTGVAAAALKDPQPKFGFDTSLGLYGCVLTLRGAFVTPATPASLRVTRRKKGRVDLELKGVRIGFSPELAAEQERRKHRAKQLAEAGVEIADSNRNSADAVAPAAGRGPERRSRKSRRSGRK